MQRHPLGKAIRQLKNPFCFPENRFNRLQRSRFRENRVPRILERDIRAAAIIGNPELPHILHAMNEVFRQQSAQYQLRKKLGYTDQLHCLVPVEEHLHGMLV